MTWNVNRQALAKCKFNGILKTNVDRCRYHFYLDIFGGAIFIWIYKSGAKFSFTVFKIATTSSFDLTESKRKSEFQNENSFEIELALA